MTNIWTDITFITFLSIGLSGIIICLKEFDYFLLTCSLGLVSCVLYLMYKMELKEELKFLKWKNKK